MPDENMPKRRITPMGREIEDLGEYVFENEEEQRRTEEILAIYEESCRVNFRWGNEQLALIKQVADAMGVPYQTYLKMAAYKQAVADAHHLGLMVRETPPPAKKRSKK